MSNQQVGENRERQVSEIQLSKVKDEQRDTGLQTIAQDLNMDKWVLAFWEGTLYQESCDATSNLGHD